MVHLLALVLALGSSLTVLGPGALAPADPLVLETVEVVRVKYGYGLVDFAPVGTVRIAVQDCAHLGSDALIITQDGDTYQARVVDCQQAEHTPLSQLGIVADVSRAELGHKKGLVILWTH